MDISFNGPAKNLFRNAVHRRASVIRAKNFDREDAGLFHEIEESECTRHTFTATLKEAMSHMQDKVLVGGYKMCGLFPFNTHKPFDNWEKYPGNLKNKKTAELIDNMKEKIAAGVPEVPHEEVYSMKLPTPTKDRPPKYASIVYVYDDETQEHIKVNKCLQKLVVPHTTAEIVSIFGLK